MVDTEGHSVLFIIVIIRTIKLQQAAGSMQFRQPSSQYCSPSSALLISRGLSLNEQPQQEHRLIYLPKTQQFSSWQLLIKVCHPWFCSLLDGQSMEWGSSFYHFHMGCLLGTMERWGGVGGAIMPHFLKQRKVDSIILRALGTGHL